MLCRKKSVKSLFVFCVTILFLSSLIVPFLFLPVAGTDASANSDVSPSNGWFYSGWQYRKAHDLTSSQPATSLSFYSVSSAVATFSGNPDRQHAFQPVHDSAIQEVNKVVDGDTWKYLGYDCEPFGLEINLFYTNDTAGTWTAYSQNPILGPNAYYYRWPSTTYFNGVFHMFIEDYSGGTLERWTSTDGITYTFAENVKVGGNEYKNPFIWLNPNDGRWYLYSHDSSGSTESFKVRSASSVTGLGAASDTVVLSRNLPFGSPTITYYAGKYWLLGEIYSNSVWQVVAYYSNSPSSGFVQATNSPILTNDAACPMIFLMPSQTQAFLYTTVNSASWNEMTQEINLDSPISPPQSSLSDYQVKITVNYGSGASAADNVYLDGHCKTNFGDVRFTWFNPTSNSEVECPYWIEQATTGSNAVFWVKVPQISGTSNSSLYIYYGNSAASTTSNGNLTFEFFDDFSDGLTKWTAVGGTWQIQNGELVAQTNNFGQRLRANNFVFANNSLHVKMEWTAGTYFENAPCIRGQSPNEQNNGYMTFLSTWNEANRERISIMRNGGESVLASQGSTNPSLNVWYTCVFSAVGNFLKSSITPLYPTAISTTDNTFASGTLCLFDWSAAAETVRFDNIFVTKYSNPEPIHGNWYTEEEKSTNPPATVLIDNAFVSDAHANLLSTQTVGFHAQWSNGSSITSGNIFVNGTQYALNSSGWATFNAESPSGYEETTVTKPLQASYIASNGVVYVGSGASLYKSLDQGITWQPSLLTFNSTGAVQIDCVYASSNCLFVSPNASASAGELGIWRSVDWGQTWSHVLALPADCNIWTMTENSSGALFAGVYTAGPSAVNARIYRSTDNGASWGTVYYDASARHVHCVYVDPSTNYVYGIVGDEISPWDIHYVIRSTDGGDNWAQILNGMPQMTAMEAVGGARFFLTDSAGNGQIYRTTDDSGYSSVFDTEHGCYGFWIRANPLNGDIYASFVSDGLSTYAAIFVSSDGGSTWHLYKTLSVQDLGDYLGSGTASNFYHGTLYYSVQLSNSGYQNGAKIYFNAAPSKSTWAVTGVNVNGVTSFTQNVSNPSIIWDEIRISSGGLTKTVGSLGDNVTTWFTANYQYDNSVFDGGKGTLYVNSLPMQWSSTNNRWERLYTISTVGPTAFKVSSVQDNQYGLTQINDLAGTQTLYVIDQPFYITTNSTVSQFAFNSTSKILAFTVSGPSGTTGFMNLTISKALIDDTNSLNVYIDGESVSYTVTGSTYYWSIHLSYHHSTHEVIINFGSPASDPSTQTSTTNASPKTTTSSSSASLPAPTTSPQITPDVNNQQNTTPIKPDQTTIDLAVILLGVVSILLSVLILLEANRIFRKNKQKT